MKLKLKSCTAVLSAIAIAIVIDLLLITAWHPSARADNGSAGTDNPDPPATTVKLIFIHHSCGENWLNDSDGGLGIALRDNNYYVSDTNYGWGPDSIGDNTDIGHWYNWFLGPNRESYTSALYTEYNQNSYYSRLSTDPGGGNEVVLFKSCYPNSHLAGVPEDLPTTGDNPLRGEPSWSEYHTIANAKGIYNELLSYFASRQDKMFVVVTAPPLMNSETSAAGATNARAFNNWLVDDWLDGYAYNNVAVFDFYNVLTSNGGHPDANDTGTESGNHHRWWSGTVQHIQSESNNYSAYPGGLGGGSHPTAAGNQKATAEFVQLLNVFYHRWKKSPTADEYRVYLPIILKGYPSPSPEPSMPEPSGSRLGPEDLTYQGAFRLPDAFNWGARGMTYYPDGNSGQGTLFIIGFDLNQAEFGEVIIPKPTVKTDWQDLPEASVTGAMQDFDDSIVKAVSEDTAYASGIEYVPKQGDQIGDKLYGAIDNWYGVGDNTHPTIWFSELNGTNPRGPYHVGPQELPFHGNKTGDFLFKVPQWYADAYLGGRILVTGKTRGAFNGSQGPALFAFHPWSVETPSGELDAIPLLWYRIIYPGCAGPNVGDKALCDYPDFTMCDKWEGGGFVESGQKRSIILLGVKGLGTNFYGDSPSSDACGVSRGYHCDPFERQVIFYDVDELGRAAQGQLDPWTVVPYAIWKPSDFFLKDDDQGHSCGEMGGLTVDPTGKRLFMIEKGFGGYQNENAAAVHVWRIK